jgi:hypothetical protein
MKAATMSTLTLAELRCLKRTRIAQDFGRREIDPEELVGVFDGPCYQGATWDRLKTRGLVANGVGLTVRLTIKGKKLLKELGE